MRLALTIEYDGTRYHGFQYQVNAQSIQGELEQAIVKLTGERVRVKGAGRTDAGVHAEAQVVAFDTAAERTAETFVRALNYYLPNDIAVKEAHIVAPDFDPRRNAISRAYRYSILNSKTRSPLATRFSCHIRDALNAERMHEAARLFIGERDFHRFAAPLPASKTSSIRAVYEASVAQSGNAITIWVRGSAFLQHQVRRMSGALVDIGRGKLSAQDLQAMLNGERTDKVAHSLPAHGLCLVSVEYARYPPSAQDEDLEDAKESKS